MTLGRVRDLLPRVVLELPGMSGPLSVEFIVDTAFDGDMALPPPVLRRLDARPAGSTLRALGDGTVQRFPMLLMDIRWNEEPRTVAILSSDGNPLLGTNMLEEWLVQIDMREGGEVLLEPPN
jgi:clan AA aspartic protease